MSKANQRNKRSKAVAERTAQQRAYDRGIYAVIIMVGLFGLGLWFLIHDESFPHAVVGFVAAVLGFVNWCTFKAWRGMGMSHWQQSLARLPLRFAGYGAKGAKPLEAAKGQDKARSALVITLLVSLAVIGLLSFLLLPELRG